MKRWDYPDPFVHELRVRPDHIDLLDHANNMAYIAWCQETAWLHSAALGLAPGSYRELDRAMAVRTARYEYLSSATAGEELRVGTWLTGSDGRLQMTRHFQIRRRSDGATLFRGDWGLVCIRISTGRPVRMPEVFLARYLPAVISAGHEGDAAG
jgi:acyl-CoA thioester hydrolase